MAAAYAFHIAESQAFIDGNKRTGLSLRNGSVSLRREPLSVSNGSVSLRREPLSLM